MFYVLKCGTVFFKNRAILTIKQVSNYEYIIFESIKHYLLLINKLGYSSVLLNGFL